MRPEAWLIENFGPDDHNWTHCAVYHSPGKCCHTYDLEAAMAETKKELCAVCGKTRANPLGPQHESAHDVKLCDPYIDGKCPSAAEGSFAPFGHHPFVIADAEIGCMPLEDPEIAAMRQIVSALEVLTDAERQRVLEWALSRYDGLDETLGGTDADEPEPPVVHTHIHIDGKEIAEAVDKANEMKLCTCPMYKPFDPTRNQTAGMSWTFKACPLHPIKAY